MKKLVQLLVTFALATALLGSASATELLAPAAAAEVSQAASVFTAKTTSAKALSQAHSKALSRIKVSKRCKTRGVVLCIDKTRDKLYYVKKGKVRRSMDARFGCSATRTRQGTFRVFRKSRHHVSTLYHTAMPWAMFFSGGQAVHYSADFAARGYAGCSHGCVNIRNRSGIAWVYAHTKIGTKVVVYRS